MTRSVHALRRIVGAVAIGTFVLIAGVALLVQLAPATGRDLFVIASGSMEPNIPVGALVAVQPTDSATITKGDIVTIRAANGVVITHRVVGISNLPDGAHFQLKGDANATADPNLVAASELVGRVTEVVPFAGYLRTFLSSPVGLVGALALLGMLSLTSFMPKPGPGPSCALEPMARQP